MKTYLQIALSLLVIAAMRWPAAAESAHKKQPFSVKDSIEMTTFSDPYTRTADAIAKEAPDRSGFVVVTTRGVLQTNELESSLWFYPEQSLKRFLDNPKELPPQPKLLFRQRAVPVASQSNSYGSLLRDVHWSIDSRSVLLSAERREGVHHLIKVEIREGRVVDLTPHATTDVRFASAIGNTVAYLEKAAPIASRDSEQAEVVLTGQTLFHILYPTMFPEPKPVMPRWFVKVSVGDGKGGFKEVRSLPLPSPAALLNFAPILSPDARSLLTVLPVDAVSDSWKSYLSANASLHYPESGTRATEHSGQDSLWPWEYVVLDIQTGKVHQLLHAPVDWTVGYDGIVQASWSSDGKHVLLTSTYLPIEKERPTQDRSILPCAIAVYDVATAHTSCISQVDSNTPTRFLMNAQFDGTGDRIEATWQSSSGSFYSTYERSDAGWDLRSHERTTGAADTMRVVIHQDLTIPPTLWVEEAGQARLLWNPNPQLSDRILAKGRVIRWTDDSGYQWRGALLTPPTPKPPNGYPLVIQTHGFRNEHEFMADGAFTSGMAAQPLACSGIAVLQMEDRSDRHARPPDNEAEDADRGIFSALDELMKAGDIDASNVGIIGFSRTHWYVERALETAPERFKAATLIDGVDQSYVTDILFVPEFPLLASDHEKAIGSAPFGAGLPQWLKRAPGFNVDRIQAAVRLEAINPSSVLGEWETYSLLRQLHKRVDLVEISNGQHILQSPKDRFASQQGDVDWFRFWLQAYVPPSRSGTDQYVRWLKLRTSQAPPSD